MSKRILLVDDEPEILDFLKYTLEQAAYEVSTCSSGKLVFDKVKTEKPDLVVLDVMLPGMDGYSLQQKIAGDPETKDIPIVVLTALEPSKILFSKFPQVVAFLTKPIKEDKLLEAVNLALTKGTESTS